MMTKDKLSKIYVGNINKEATEEDLRKFIEENGMGAKQITGLWLKRGFAFIDCADQSSADALIDKLQGQEFMGQKLTLEPSVTSGANAGLRARVFGTEQQPSVSAADTLKILIPSEFVGAIIGRAGANIKELTTSTGARINILRNRSHVPTDEKTACIIGSPERCSAACRKILEICEAEAANLKEGKEVSLKILANNSLIGKIIGKDGRNIKKIMQDTQTKIHVSHQVQSDPLHSDLSNPIINVERVITVRGSVEAMSMAEALISAKLKTPPGLSMYSGGGGSDFRSFLPSGFYPFGMGPGASFNSLPFGWDGTYGMNRFPPMGLSKKNLRLRV